MNSHQELPAESVRTLLHALNNQLGVVMGALDIMTLDPTLSERTQRMVKMAQEGAQKMTHVIRDFKDTESLG